MKSNYLIVCQARSGSTMLSTALASHPEVAAHGEVLNTRSDDRLEVFGLNYQEENSLLDKFRELQRYNPVFFLEEFIFHCGRFKSSGFKFKYEEMSSPLYQEALAYVARRKDLKVIFVRREDMFSRYVSEFIALNITGVFNSTDKAIQVPDKPIHIDPQKIQESFERSDTYRSKFDVIFSEHKSITVTYEEMLSSPEEMFHIVTGFLGVSHTEFQPRTKQIKRSVPIEEYVENYQEIRDYFSQTKYQKYFL